MLSITITDYLLIWQFVTRTNSELPHLISCLTDGGPWEKTARLVRFKNNISGGNYTADIYANYVRFGKIKIRKPLGYVKFEREKYTNILDDEESVHISKVEWRFQTLCGFILLGRIDEPHK